MGWIGMLFSSTTSVRCIRIKNSDWGKAAYEIRIQAFDTNLNEWEDAWIARDLDISKSAWNTVSMDYPSDDNPTPTPSSPPTSPPPTSPPPTKNPTNAPVLSPITPNPITNPTRNPTSRPTLNPTMSRIISSTGWRIWASPSNLEENWAWDVDELEFYNNLDCTGNKISTNGAPIDSGNAGSGWGPDNAFGGWVWGGRPDSGGVFWIGMLFSSTTSVRCIRIKNSDWGKAAYEIRIQAFDTNLNEWEDAWIARDLDISKSAWNTVSIDYPSDDNPTPTPSSPPTSPPPTSPPPTKNPTNAPVLSPITPNPTSAPTESPTKTPTLSPTKACSRKRQPCQTHKDCCPKKNGRRRKCHRRRKVCR